MEENDSPIFELFRAMFYGSIIVLTMLPFQILFKYFFTYILRHLSI